MAEKLVEKCGISYEEAGEVLKQADYDLLEAMIILERQGKLGSKSKNSYSTGFSGDYVAYPKETESDPENFHDFMRLVLRKIREILIESVRCRIIISRQGREWVDFPVILAVILLIFTGGAVLIPVVISIFCGCSYSIYNTNNQ